MVAKVEPRIGTHSSKCQEAAWQLFEEIYYFEYWDWEKGRPSGMQEEKGRT